MLAEVARDLPTLDHDESTEADFSVVTFIVLLAAVAIRVALVLFVVWWLIPARRRCPHCGELTATLVTHRGIRRIRLERRWCLTCGWEGIARRRLRPDTRQPAPRPVPESPEDSDTWSEESWDSGGWIPPDDRHSWR